MTFSIIVAGATGAIGREVVIESIKDPRVSRVVALSRRELPPTDWASTFGQKIDLKQASQKLVVVPVDWERLAASRESYLKDDSRLCNAFTGNHFAAMCLGTTRKDAGSGEAFRRCDFDYVVAFGQAVKSHSQQLRCFSQISSQGASAGSWFLYMKTKGEADVAIAALEFSRTSVFRPGLLERGEKKRGVESFFGCFTTAMPVSKVAIALLRNLFDESQVQSGVQYFHNSDIYKLSAS